MFTCIGFAAQSAEAPLAPFSFERRDPGPEDVRIDILYCGICHSDIHTARGEWGSANYPVVPSTRSSDASPLSARPYRRSGGGRLHGR